jgi:hypothetical protein
MSISIQLSVTNSFKTQTVKDPESLSKAMSISIQLSVTNSYRWRNKVKGKYGKMEIICIMFVGFNNNHERHM